MRQKVKDMNIHSDIIGPVSFNEDIQADNQQIGRGNNEDFAEPNVESISYKENIQTNVQQISSDDAANNENSADSDLKNVALENEARKVLVE